MFSHPTHSNCPPSRRSVIDEPIATFTADVDGAEGKRPSPLSLSPLHNNSSRGQQKHGTRHPNGNQYSCCYCSVKRFPRRFPSSWRWETRFGSEATCGTTQDRLYLVKMENRRVSQKQWVRFLQDHVFLRNTIQPQQPDILICITVQQHQYSEGLSWGFHGGGDW